MGDVVTLNGSAVVPPGEANPRVVAVLEELLEAAQSGEVRGLVISVYHADDAHSRRCAGPATMATIGNLERLKHHLCDWMDGRPTDEQVPDAPA